MIQATFKTGIGLIALLILSACATQAQSELEQDYSELQADEGLECQHPNTLTCDKFAGEVRNCTCQKGDKLRDMLDAYTLPDY